MGIRTPENADMEKDWLDDPAFDKVLNALGGKRTREILFRIIKSKKAVIAKELAQELKITKPAMSQHLRKLEDAGLIRRSEQKVTRGTVQLIEAEVTYLRDCLSRIIDSLGS